MSRTFYPPPSSQSSPKPSKQRTALVLLALVAVWTISLVPALSVVWGVVFVLWAGLALWTGETYLFGSHNRQAEPLLFWLVALSWLAMGMLWVVAPPT